MHPHHVVAVDDHPDRVVERPRRTRQLRPSAASTASPPWSPIHSDDAMSGRRPAASPPRRPHGRRATAPRTSGRASTRTRRAPESDCWPSRNTSEPADQRVQPGRRAVGGTGIGGRHIGGVPAVGEPVVERGTVGVDHVGPLMSARASVQMICAASSCRLCGSVVVSVLQVDARPAVAAADAGLAAVGAGHRTAQPQRRLEHVAHAY